MNTKQSLLALSLLMSAATLPHAALAQGYGEGDAKPAKEAAAVEAPASSEQHWLKEALFDGDLAVQLRYRYQTIEDGGFAERAHASTIRALVKYETKPVHGISLLGELRTVQRLGAGNLHNDGLNGITSRPAIPDADALEVDQAFVRLNDIVPDTELSVGRRKIALNNQRFISTLPFRQNSNSFDGVVVENTSLPDTRLHYSYAYNFNRAFTDDSVVGNFDEADIHLIHAEHDINERHKLVGYGYLLGIEASSFVTPTANASNFATNTYGANLKGWEYIDSDADVKFHYDVEYAHQTDHSENTNDFDLNYYRIQPGISYGGLRLNVGYEVLEGDGNIGFSTPLALLHAFNGFADVFVGTPADGLEDAYVNATYFLPESGVKIGDYDLFGNMWFHVAYHDFQAENSSVDFGTEFDASIKKKLRDDLTLVLEYAHYDADFNGPVTPASPSFQRDRDQFYSALIFNF